MSSSGTMPVGQAMETEGMEDTEDVGSEPPAVIFDPVETAADGTLVLILTMGGENLKVWTQDNVSVGRLKEALAVKLDRSIHEFHLTIPGREGFPADDMLVVALLEGADALECDGGVKEKMVTMYLVKVTTLERHEAKGREAWCELAAQLRNHEINDDDLLVSVRDFLDQFPALINWQSTCVLEPTLFKPLLSHAVESVPDMQLRKKCVDELIKRGARLHIRHEQGFLIEEAKRSGSVFIDYLNEQINESKAYDQEAIAAWREVSSKLCGETSRQVHDENEMTRIVEEFCKKYPQMVNFQNNHAVNTSNDMPYGYFRYAPLMTFAGAQACRLRRGQGGEHDNVRKGAVEELLRHGARVDTSHGGKTSLEWMISEGSQLVGWLEAQLKAPMPMQEPFVLQLPGAAART